MEYLWNENDQGTGSNTFSSATVSATRTVQAGLNLGRAFRR
jgi:hypothetical protein